MITRSGTGAPPQAGGESALPSPRSSLQTNGKCHNVPRSLEPVVNKWLAANKDFYLGPENIFRYDSHRIQYLSNPDIPTAPGTWYCDNRTESNGQIPELNY